jgi:integrase/recombinase XerD
MIGEKKLKSSTIAITLVAVRRFYTSAVAQKLVKENPVIGIKPPREKVDAAERITFLEEELRHLLSMIPRDNSLENLRDLALVAIMALQGPRTKELHQADFGDLMDHIFRISYLRQ